MSNDREDVLNDPMINIVALTATEIQFLEWLANVILDKDNDSDIKLMAIAVAIQVRAKYVG